jgi:Tfp pilus assembly protein PilN
MLKQQINLLPPKPKVKKDWLQAKPVFIGLSIVIVVCMLATLGMFLRSSNLNQQFDEMSAARASQQDDIKQMEAKVSARQVDPDLILSRTQMQKSIASKQSLLTLLDKVQPGHREGFAQSLFVMANTIPEGVWLTEFELQANLQLKLVGASQQASAIPLFLRQVVQEKPFNFYRTTALVTEQGEGQGYPFEATLMRGTP